MWVGFERACQDKSDVAGDMISSIPRGKLMNRRQAIGALGGTALAAAPAAAVKARLIGVWTLIRCERKLKDGRTEYPYGEKPAGRISYDKAGRMSAQLMRPGRRSTVTPGLNFIAGNAGADEIREAVAGYAAYYGTFDVDASSTTVIHHVQGALVPSWVGTDLKRTYRFEGKQRLLLSATTSLGVLDLLWERESS